MNTVDVSVCANCGKEGTDINNICNKFKQVKYCNASCKKKHRSKHKKECEEHIRLDAERAAKLHDEKLFKQPPSEHGDCQICFVRLPSLTTGYKYNTCCGKVICSGCIYAPVYDNQGNKIAKKKCVFCRVPYHSTKKEAVERLMKRVDAGDAQAMYELGCCYRDGVHGFSRNYEKALELWHRAGELGYSRAHCNIGYCYIDGKEVAFDEEMAVHYYELAAIRGNERARHNLGLVEEKKGDMNRAMRHFMIAVRGGCAGSLDKIKRLYSNGSVTKEDYMKALQTYQEYLGEIKSDQRDKAAAAKEENRYY